MKNTREEIIVEIDMSIEALDNVAIAELYEQLFDNDNAKCRYDILTELFTINREFYNRKF